jgi:GT2 family glycosyltransferase/glycosyltransferase involved in cell wall biosynthesis
MRIESLANSFGGYKFLLKKIWSVYKDEGLSGLKWRWLSLNEWRFTYRNNANNALHGKHCVELDKIPKLADILAEPIKGANRAHLLAILGANRETVCMLGHHLRGGAEDYADRRRDKLLAHGRAVLTIKYYNTAQRLVAEAQAGEELLCFSLEDLAELGDPGFPRLSRFIVNSFVSWTMKIDGQFLSPYAALPLLLASFQRVADAHQAIYEVLWHDHYPICPNYILLNHEGHYCGLPKPGVACVKCLIRMELGSIPIVENATPNFVTEWRAAWGEFLRQADRVVCFSRSSQALVRQVFQLGPGKLILSPHDPLIFWTKPYRPPSEGPMTVAVIGNINRNKGAFLVAELAKLMAPEEKLVIIGSISCRNILPAEVIVTGPYQRENLPELLASHRVTVGFISSVVPETFNYVTQECMGLGLPLVCLPIGACPERIEPWPYGLVAQEISASSALETIRRLDARRRAASSAASSSQDEDLVEEDARLDAVLADFWAPGEKPHLQAVVSGADQGIDILLSAHNGFEFLEPCLNSVIAHTDLPFRFFLNDDASDDSRVMAVFREIQRKLPSTWLHRNESNQGFTASVDKMLRLSDRDVVLLNTDTLLPPGWASRLMWPIRHSGIKVASATPLANSGTLCAFPYLNQDSDIFDGLPMEAMDEICQNIKPEGWQEIPTGVGFCMAMSRRALDEAGSFDVETFSPGYGEEVDWCRRTAFLGYRHALVTNLFVWHKHGGSFKRLPSAARLRLLISHGRIIELRYPDYITLIREVCIRSRYLVQRDILLFLAVIRASGGLGLVSDATTGKQLQKKTADGARAVIRSALQGQGFELEFRYKEYGSCLKASRLEVIYQLLGFDEYFSNT